MTTSPKTERSHEEPFQRQFTVFMANRVGQLAELLDAMGTGGLEIAALSVVDCTEWAAVRFIFLEPGKGRDFLQRRGLAFTECDILAILLDKPDALQRACKALLAAELNIHFAYPMFLHRDQSPVIALHADDHVLAAQVLRKHGLTLLGHEDQ